MKKNTSKKNLYGKASLDNQTKTLIKISIGVIIVVLAVYFGTAILTGEIKLGKEEEKTEEVTIQYEEIIAGQILNRKEEEYYVLLFNFSSADSSRYLLLRSNYLNAKEKNMYIVDLEKRINSSIVTEEENNKNNISDIKDLKVNTSTILKVKNGKIVERINGQDKVFEYIKSLYE